MCCEGPPFNGGKPLNNYGICEHFCLTDALGFAFCGNGPNYKNGHDCRKCRPIDGIQFAICLTWDKNACCTHLVLFSEIFFL